MHSVTQRASVAEAFVGRLPEKSGDTHPLAQIPSCIWGTSRTAEAGDPHWPFAGKPGLLADVEAAESTSAQNNEKRTGAQGGDHDGGEHLRRHGDRAAPERA